MLKRDEAGHVLISSTALGRVQRGKLFEDLHGPLSSCQGRRIQQRWYQIPYRQLRSTNEALGYRDGYVGLFLPYRVTVKLALNRSRCSGQCLKAFSNGKRPHVITFHPDEDKQHIFLAGMQDKKIIQVGLEV